MRTYLVSAKARVMNALALFQFLLPVPRGNVTATGAPLESRRRLLALAREEKAEATFGKAIGFILGGSVLLAFAYVIALTMFPFLTSGVAEAQADENTSARDSRMIGLIPTIFLIVIIVSGLSLLTIGIKQTVDLARN